MSHIEALISDADGTLVNTVSLIRHGQYETARTYFVKHGIPADEIPDYETYEVLLNQTVGGTARNTLEKTARLLYAESPHHLDGMDFEELHGMLNPVQDRIAVEHVKPYDGLSDTLHKLGAFGIKFAIFTSGTAHHIVRNFGVALPELDLTSLHLNKDISDEDKLGIFVDSVKSQFSIPEFTVVTAHDIEREKPHPDSLILAMQRLGVVPGRSAVLGDHKVDMQTAINAGVINRIGITHGFDDRATLEAAGATQIIDSLEELTGVLHR